MPENNNRGILIIIIIAVIISGIVFYLYFRPEAKQAIAPGPGISHVYTPPDKKETIPQPSGIITLPDSSRVFLIGGNSTVIPAPDFGSKREVNVDGDVFFEIRASARPLIIKTRLLILSVTGKSTFRVMAFKKDDGEEIQVISGNIHVQKAYQSQFDEPEDLTAGQMVMINVSIDLMEKEDFDTQGLRVWRDSVRITDLP